MESISKRKKGRDTLIVILGATATGKSALAVKLAKEYNGEIVSADSRQVYKGMDIGSGKITKKEMLGIPHHLLDVASPKRRFSVLQYQKLAQKEIKNIQKRNKLPFLVGGSALYLYSIIDNLQFPQVKTDAKLRNKLEKQTAKDLFSQLKTLDPRRAKTIEKDNKRRLIRAIEIVLTTKKPVPKLKKQSPLFNTVIIGINKPEKELKQLIKKRLDSRLKKGMLKEVKTLHASGISWRRLEEFGLEYRFIAQYLQNKISKKEMIEKLQREIERFVKYQMRWFKKDNRIHWIRTKKQAKRLLQHFL